MPFSGYEVTSDYGFRKDPFGSGKTVFHAGIDLIKNHKDPIYAFVGGIVVYAGEGKTDTGLGGYGHVVLIKDANGRGHLYAHLDSVAVNIGANVSKGQLIGRQGKTGKVTGSHLHYEIRKTTFPSYGWTGDATKSTSDPTQYLKSFENSQAVSKPTQKDNTPKLGSTYRVTKDTAGYLTAADAKAGKNRKTTVKTGNYYVYNKSNGMINLTSKNGTPGSWINPSGVAVVESKPTKKLHLPKTDPSWRVYPLDKSPVKGNEKGYLNPKKFGGLTYEIIANPQKDVYTIKTSDFGTVNIYAATSTGAVIK